MSNTGSNERLVSEWCNEFSTLYEKHDKNRTPQEIWISVMAYGSQIGEAIRRVNYVELIDAAAHFFNWMCTFIAKCNSTGDPLFKCNDSFCDIVFLKFPAKCGHCGHSECKCDPFAMDEKKDKAAKYKELHDDWILYGEKRFHISDWIRTFKKIFGGRIYLMTLENIGFHFLEEAGEEAQAIRQLEQLRGIPRCEVAGIDKAFFEKISSINGLVEEYEKCFNLQKDPIKRKLSTDIKSREPEQLKARIVKGKMDLVIEFADTFSWFCAILIKLEMITSNLSIHDDISNLENKLQSMYGAKGATLKCPRCGDDDCQCVFYPAVGESAE